LNLKIKDLLQCSCQRFFREKTSISSVFGDEVNIYLNGDDVASTIATTTNKDSEVNEENSQYDSDEEDDDYIQYRAQTKEPLKYQEMPNQVCQSKQISIFII
jgi:hypothetical protein